VRLTSAPDAASESCSPTGSPATEMTFRLCRTQPGFGSTF
jgi:hypothetical protein